MTERLSQQQAEFLVWLLEGYQERPDAETPLRRRMDTYLGVPIGRLPKGTSRSESASQSRMLRRLEDRGLIERRSFPGGLQFLPAGQWQEGHRRTTHVRLTAEGYDLAERLSAPGR